MSEEYQDRDRLTGDLLVTPAEIRTPTFARQYQHLVIDYARCRLEGIEAERAFQRAFGTDYQDQYLARRVEALEHSDVYRSIYGALLAERELADIFDVKKAIMQWMQIIGSSTARDTSKVAAIKELQVLYGLTVIDANGNTRAGKSLADFYREQVKPLTGEPGDLHPEPGSPEARAFEEGAPSG